MASAAGVHGLGVLHGLPGGLELPAQPALVHARAGQLGQLAVGLLDGGGGGRALLEDPLEVLLGGPLLGPALVEGVPDRLDRGEVLAAGRRGAAVAQAAPSTMRALPALEVLELVAGGVAVVHRAGGDGVEPGAQRSALLGPLAGERRRRPATGPRSARAATATRRPRRPRSPAMTSASRARSAAFASATVSRLCRLLGRASGAGLFVTSGRYRRIDPTTPLAPWLTVPSGGSYRPTSD